MVKKSGFSSILISVMTLLILAYVPASAHETGNEVIDDFEVINIAGDFRLVDNNGKSHALSYYSDYKAALFIGQANACASSFHIDPRLRAKLIDLENRKIIKTFFINARPRDARESVSEEMAKASLDFPVLMDITQTITRSLNLSRAGDFTVQGLSDFAERGRGSLSQTECLLKLLDGIERETGGKTNSVISCDVGAVESIWNRFRDWGRANAACRFDNEVRPVTYDEVAPVLARNCLGCHYDEKFGSFADYQKVVGWSAMIKQVIRIGLMPPGGRDLYYKGFTDDMDESEIRLIMDWIDGGTRGGHEYDLLQILSKRLAGRSTGVRKFGSIQQPDIVFKQKKAHMVPASGFVEYKYEQLAGPLPEDIYVQGMNMIVNDAVVHHANLFLLERPLAATSMKELYDGMKKIGKFRVLSSSRDEHGKSELVEEVIMLTSAKEGRSMTTLPNDLTYFMPKGRYLVVEYHYTPSGKVEKNQGALELYTYKEKETNLSSLRNVKRLAFKRSGFVIRPGQADFVVKSSATIDRDMTALAFKPHMHYRGKSVRFLATYPNGQKKLLLSVPFFQMKRQPMHYLSKGVFLPNGTLLETEVEYDNSRQNAQNPDPTIHVPLGSQTYTDEMHFPRMFFVEGMYKGRLQRRTVRDYIDSQIDLIQGGSSL